MKHVALLVVAQMMSGKIKRKIIKMIPISQALNISLPAPVTPKKTISRSRLGRATISKSGQSRIPNTIKDVINVSAYT